MGAGSGEEAVKIWSEFGDALTLVDIGPHLIDNCKRQAPFAKASQATAEALSDIASSSMGLYCALRTYQSVYLNIEAAICEAFRVLRPGGVAIISISDAYPDNDGNLISGQLTADGYIDLSVSGREVSAVATHLYNTGFKELKLLDMATEWAICGKKIK